MIIEQQALPSWLQVGLTRSIAIFPAIIVAFNNTVDNMDGLINIMQAIQLPFALIPLLKFTSSPLMMKEFKNHKYVTIFCITVSSIIIGVNMSKVIPQIFEVKEGESFELTKNRFFMITAAIIYIGIIVSVILSPVKSQLLLDSEGNTSESEQNEDIELKKMLLNNEKDLEQYSVLAIDNSKSEMKAEKLRRHKFEESFKNDEF